MPSARHLLLAAVLAVLSLAPRAAHADACDVNRGVLGCQNTLTPTKINNDLWASITSLFDTERYGCRPGSDYGEGQDAWLFSCVYTGRVRIDMIQNDCDIDLFLLKDGCGQGNCLKGSWNGSNSFEHVEFQCQQGSIYYVALERVDNDVWPWQDCTIWGSFKYTLKISCFEECEDGFDNDLDGKIDCLDPDCPVCFERCDDLRDNDFDGLVDCNDPDCRSAATCCDKDSDGYLSMDGLCAGIDCNDTKGSGSLIFPGAAETIADGVDQDCDGFEICYIDNDGDGFGQEVTTKSLIFTCQGPGVAPVAGDCDDLNPEVYPFRPEIPINGIDDNCDLLEDCYNDGDGDGFGADFIKQSPDLTCTQGNVADNNDDCDDNNEYAYPGAVEIPLDGVDENCDARELCHEDKDGDGFGNPNKIIETAFITCEGPGVSLDSTDCDDSLATGAAIFPGATELVADGVDQNCDNQELCYIDGDQDLFGNNLGNTVLSSSRDCSAAGVSANKNDCNDLDPTSYPGANDPAGDGIDQNCDGLQDCYLDQDGDGWGTDVFVPSSAPGCIGVNISPKNGDCNDNVRAINPDAQEAVNDGVDQNCDFLEACYKDLDGDGYGRDETTTSANFTCIASGVSNRKDDCNDTPIEGFSIHPGAPEVPLNGFDDNCDGFEFCYKDADSDGFGVPTSVTPYVSTKALGCNVAGVSLNADDCNDNDFRVKPGAVEKVADNLDQDCDTFELCYVDKDDDNYGVDETISSNDIQCAGANLAKNKNDCDDLNALVYPGATPPPGAPGGVDYSCSGLTTCYLDNDQDGYGRNVPVESNDPNCLAVQPGGIHTSSNNDDCNDENPLIKPGATEIPRDDVDQDCDGFEICFQDLDNDGYGSKITQLSDLITCNGSGVSKRDDDCNDNPASNGFLINPDAVEIPVSGVDENCDLKEICYEDRDFDLYGSTKQVLTTDLTCVGGGLVGGFHYANNDDDCADNLTNRNPGRAEVPSNGFDENCDNKDDCYIDADGDGYGRPETIPSPYGLTCVGAGVSQTGDDCLDIPPEGFFVNKNAVEIIGDGIDQNCDQKEDCWIDADDDNYGGPAHRLSSSILCQEPDLALAGGDCDDGKPAIHPNAIEIPADGVDQDCDNLEDCFLDQDRDDYGSKIIQESASILCQGDGIADNDDDCFDIPPAGASIFPFAPEIIGNGIDEDCDGFEGCYVDGDLDGYGKINSNVVQTDAVDCKAPGFSTSRDDCDDTKTAIHPGAPETPVNNLDENCDGKEDCYQDLDGDTFGSSVIKQGGLSCTGVGISTNDLDCNDVLPGGNFIFPGAVEKPGDGIDQDCDQTEACFFDGDSDGWGVSPNVKPLVITPAFNCVAPNAAPRTGDCDDAMASVHPTATEVVANQIDEDCDLVDSCWQDIDGDTWGSSVIIRGKGLLCDQPGEAVQTGDCVDQGTVLSVRSKDINPAAVELCNGVDDDCDNTIDDEDGNVMPNLYWFPDEDDDGWGDTTRQEASCESPGPRYTQQVGDCDDENPDVNPAATELCDPFDIDEDCNGFADSLDVDPATGLSVAEGALEYSPDVDGDLYGSSDPAKRIRICDPPGGHVQDNTDCDDGDPLRNPGKTEVVYDPLGKDEDCNVATKTDDLDGDGYKRVGGDDCNDNPNTGFAIHKGATELPNGIDDDCDGKVDEGTIWGDDDGDGFTEAGGDCKDADPRAYPGAPEQPNNLDDDCDGIIDEGTVRRDDDGDGFSENQGDCNDNDPTVKPAPAGVEIMDNGKDDDCDGSVDGGTFDPDGDGYTESAEPLPDCEEGNPNVHPGAPELANNKDDDCDGVVDEGTIFGDDDGDGFSESEGDCNDDNPNVFPGQVEGANPNGVDDDCDGLIDEDSNLSDDDGDGFSEVEGDCDDRDKDIYPGAFERQNGLDDDCDGQVDETSNDVDGDGFTVEEGDCDDENGWAHPGADEVCDSIDNDCDGQVDEGTSCEPDTGDTTKPPETTCGHTGGSAPGALALALLLVGGLTRRRRAA